MEVSQTAQQSNGNYNNREHSPPRTQENNADETLSDQDKQTVASIQEFEDILEMIGPWGRWNIVVLVFGCACTFLSPLQLMSYEFLGATPNYWCRVDALREANWTQEQILSLAIPIKNDSKYGKNEGCLMYDYDYDKAVDLGFEASMGNRSHISNGDATSVISCTERDFNLSEYKSTVVTEWDLVCERRALYSTTQSVGQFGMLIGYLFYSNILDIFGRRPAALFGVFLGLACGVSVSFITSYTVYVIMKTAVAAIICGFYMGSFVIVMELCTPSQRSSVGSCFLVPWGLGYLAIPGIAYVVREWRWLQAAYSLPTALFFIYICILPESPRWLIHKERYQAALATITRAARINGKVLPSSKVLLAAMENLKAKEEKSEESNSVHGGTTQRLKDTLALVLDEKLRVRTLIIFVNWLVTSMVYFGLSLNSTNLSADPYLYMALGGVLEVPSYVLLWPLIAYLGRKASLITLHAVCAVTMISITTIMVQELDVSVALMMFLSLSGKMAVTASFQLLFVYTAEIYPIRFRSLSVGNSSMMARIGSLTSPFIVDILGEVKVWAPTVVFAVTLVGAALLVLLLPETKGTNLTEEDCTKSGPSESTAEDCNSKA